MNSIPPHKDFAQFENRKPNIGRLVNNELDFAHLNPQKIFIKDAGIHEIWLVDELPSSRFVSDKSNIRALARVLARLPIRRVIH